MLVLFETSLGFCLFALSEKGQLTDKNLHKKLSTPEGASNLLRLQSIHRFKSTADAVEDITAISDGKLSKSLKKFLTEEVQGKLAKDDQLIVGDNKLGGAIAKKLGISVISDSTTQDLFRGIREQLASLLSDVGVDEKDLSTMSLGLSHSLSRYKLKFSPDKVDTMIVQAIALLDDLDKEINIYAMRVKEWYGWHFPEMAKIINDNLAYAKCIKAMGYRTNAATTDFADILPEEMEEALKAAAVISMGTEISITDLTNINLLAEQVISITNYRTELFEYLRNRMAAVAPNLTALLGELVGARLIAHAGSLMSLAKAPASTIQILGAEKALFRALKTKHDTPKYGLLFHASLVGSAPNQLKGKMARMVAGKTALAVRYDALADADTRSDQDAAAIGINGRAKLEARLSQLEAALGIQSVRRGAGQGEKMSKFSYGKNGTAYNPATDVLIPTAASTSTLKSKGPLIEEVEADAKPDKKDKKKKRKAEAMDVDEVPTVQTDEAVANGVDEDEAARKERKRLKKEAKKQAKALLEGDSAAAEASTLPQPSVNGVSSDHKKSKKRKAEDGAEVDGEKKKKKKRKSEVEADA